MLAQERLELDDRILQVVAVVGKRDELRRLGTELELHHARQTHPIDILVCHPIAMRYRVAEHDDHWPVESDRIAGFGDANRHFFRQEVVHPQRLCRRMHVPPELRVGKTRNNLKHAEKHQRREDHCQCGLQETDQLCHITPGAPIASAPAPVEPPGRLAQRPGRRPSGCQRRRAVIIRRYPARIDHRHCRWQGRHSHAATP